MHRTRSVAPRAIQSCNLAALWETRFADRPVQTLPLPRPVVQRRFSVYRLGAVGDEALVEGDTAQGRAAEGVGFDLAHCIALAGCSFEAYTDPITVPGFAARSANGTTTDYTDRGFLQETYQALLQVHLQSASHLPARDFLGKSDPYVRFNVASSTATSSIMAQTLDPKWDESFFLYIQDISKAVLTARVFDGDVFKSDDALGVAMYPLRQIQMEEVVDLELELVGDGGGGTLHLSLRLLPFDASVNEIEGYDEEDIQSMRPVEGIDDIVRESLDLPESRGIDLQSCPSAWKALAVVAGKRAEELFDPVCFIENLETNTQVWVYRHVDNQECVIAFRGTEQFRWRDLITDADTKPALFDWERSSLRSGISIDVSDLPSEELLVHHGFLEAYDSVRGRIFEVAQQITGGSPDWTIYTTGHSLGGALATLCAYEMACRWVSPGPVVKMYNFGSPRVGNHAFSTAFASAVPESWRIVSRRDLITTVPRLAGYRHVPCVVSVDQRGSLLFDEAQAERDHLEGTDINAFLQRMSFEEIGKMVLDYEIELMKRLMDGSGLEEHMELNYLNCLHGSVGAGSSDDPL